MGISYSGKKSYYLHEYVNPRVEHKSTELSLRYNIRGDTLVPEKALLLNNDTLFKSKLFPKSLLNPNEKCLILGITQLYLQNDSEYDITFYIENLFPINDKDENRENDNNNNHPDNSGSIKIFVPKKCRGVIEKDDQLLYEPQKIKNPNILRYVGMEDAILKPRTVVLNEKDEEKKTEEIFKESDPVVDFMIQHLDEIDEISAADIKEITPNEIGGATTYKISPNALEKVREFFKDAIFDIFKYTDLKETKVSWDKLKRKKEEEEEDQIIFIILRLEYLVISQNSQSVFQKRSSELKGL